MLEREPSAEQITSFEDLERFIGRHVSIRVYPDATEELTGTLEPYVPTGEGEKTYLVKGDPENDAAAEAKGENNWQWIEKKTFDIQQPRLIE